MPPVKHVDNCAGVLPECSTRFVELEAAVRRIGDDTCAIKRYMDGGADPSKGMLVRMDRIEVHVSASKDAQQEAKKQRRNFRNLVWGVVLGMGATASIAAVAFALRLWRLFGE